MLSPLIAAEAAHAAESVWSEYLNVVSDPAHILAELTFILVVDVIVGIGLWPLIKRAIKRHDRDEHGIDRDGPDFFEEDE